MINPILLADDKNKEEIKVIVKKLSDIKRHAMACNNKEALYLQNAISYLNDSYRIISERTN